MPPRIADTQAPVPSTAVMLGAAGLLPFIAGAAGLWLLDQPRHGAALWLLSSYGAVILSFMGAIHWGLAMCPHSPLPARAMSASVVPALLGWFALAIPPAAGLVVLALGFAGVQVLDVRAIAGGAAPAWYRRLRMPLTITVIASLGVALAALALRTPAPP